MENSSKTGMIAGAGCLGTIVFIFLIPIILLGSIIGFFTGDGGSNNNDVIDENFDPTQTYAFETVQPYYIEFMSDLENQMYSEGESYQENAGETPEGEEPIRVTVDCREIGYSIIFAYITALNNEETLDEEPEGDPEEGETAIEQMESLTIPSGQEIKDFLSLCTDVSVNEDQVARTVYITNVNKTAEQVADRCYTDEAMKDLFTASYEQYLEFFKESPPAGSNGSGDMSYIGGGVIGEGDGVFPETGLAIPIYEQGSPTWADYPYGDGTLAANACGPTCLAMISTYLTGQTITPVDVVEWAGRSYWVEGVGSSWGIMIDAASHFDYNASNLGNNIQAVIQALREGKPCIASMRKGTYFAKSAGHFVVLRGLTGDGKILVNDPGGAAMENLNLAFEPSFIESCARNYWCYWK